MPSNGDDDNDPAMGRRVRLIREATKMNQTEFQKWLGENGLDVSYKSWNSYEGGDGMKWQTAKKLCEILPWVTMDFIYREKVHTVEEARMLGKLPQPTDD